MADEWDRTPTEPARNLSYQDLLELKEIQRTLPRADQPADALTGRSGSHYLKKVPIGLLPLLPDSPSGEQQTSPTESRSRPTSSPMSSSWASFRPNSGNCPLPATPPSVGAPYRSNLSHHPSNLSHLPQATRAEAKPKSRFAFLPLLDGSPHGSRSRSPSPSPSDSGPPTPSLSNASLESSPLSRASSCSPEPPFMQLPPPQYKPNLEPNSYPSISPSLGNMRLSSNPYPPYGFAPSRPQLTRFVPPPPPAPTPKPAAKKKNVMYINGIEIDLDDDDDDDSSTPQPPTSPQMSMLPTSSPPKVPSSSTSSPSRRSSLSSPPSSPTLRWQTPAQMTNEPAMAALHAPMRFKRQAPKPDVPSAISTSPPTRRGSFCRPNVENVPRSPILMPRA
ncbi:hypothetical protein BKA70DRAFT_97069 [Coprinopsis sp. MPI-PUGE-AT-0042]|nr:hypothetical protein BKA70DRAFT_97069 [Coprinopsis sp. MPI-PUGE-AT-0042]